MANSVLVGWVEQKRTATHVQCCFVKKREPEEEERNNTDDLVQQVQLFYQEALKAQRKGWPDFAPFIQRHITTIRNKQVPTETYYNDAKLPAAAATSIYAHTLILQTCPTKDDRNTRINEVRHEFPLQSEKFHNLSQIAANCPQLPYARPLVEYRWHDHTNIGTTAEWTDTWVDMCIWPLTEPSGKGAWSLIGAYRGTEPTIDVLQTTAEDANTFRHRRYEFPKQIRKGSPVGLLVTSPLAEGVWLIEYLCAYRQFGRAMVDQLLVDAPRFTETIVLAATDAARVFWRNMGFQDMADMPLWCANVQQWLKNVRHAPMFIHCRRDPSRVFDVSIPPLVENLGVRGGTTATSPPWRQAQTVVSCSSDTQGDDDHRSQGQGQKRVYGLDSGSNSKRQRRGVEGG